MMNTAKVKSFRTRIQRANSSLSVAGDLLLWLDIDAMTLEDMQTLQTALIPTCYAYLDKRIAQLQR